MDLKIGEIVEINYYINKYNLFYIYDINEKFQIIRIIPLMISDIEMIIKMNWLDYNKDIYYPVNIPYYGSRLLCVWFMITYTKNIKYKHICMINNTDIKKISKKVNKFEENPIFKENFIEKKIKNEFMFINFPKKGFT